MGWIKRSWTDEQLAEAVASSKTYAEVRRKLGLCEGSAKYLKRCIEKAALATSHFDSAGRASQRRMNVTDEVLIDLVQRSRTATEVLTELGLPITGHHFDRLKQRMWRLGIKMPYFRRGPRGRRSTSWTDDQLRDAVSACTNYANVIRRLGLIPAGGNYDAIKRRIRELELDTSHFTGSIPFHGNWRRDPTPLAELLVAGRDLTSHALKLRLFAEGLQPTHRGLNQKRASRASEGEMRWNVVPGAGLEPARSCEQGVLSAVSLPFLHPGGRSHVSTRVGALCVTLDRGDQRRPQRRR